MIRKRENPVVDVKGKGRMDSMLWFYKMATATQIAPHYSQCMLRTMYEVTTHQTLKQMGYSGKRPHSVPLLLATVHRHTMSFIFCWDIQMAGSEFGVNGVKNAIVPFFSSVMVLRIFSCHTLGFIRNNLGMIIYHSLPEYYCWSCLSPYDRLVMAASSMITHSRRKLKTVWCSSCQYGLKALRNLSSNVLNL